MLAKTVDNPQVERTISASKDKSKEQEEWMICNYEDKKQATLFDVK